MRQIKHIPLFQFFLLGILMSILFAVWVGILFLILPPVAVELGVFISVLLIFPVFLLGDRFLLSAVRARKLQSEGPIVDRIRNYSCILEMNEPALYYSERLPTNIYFIEDGLRGKSSIIINKKLMNKLPEQELDPLLFSTLMKLNLGMGRLRFYHCFLFCLYYIPVHLLRRFKISRWLGNILAFIFLPFHQFSMGTLQNLKRRIKLDKNTSEILGRESELSGIIFKISTNEQGKKSDILSKIFSFFAVVDFYNSDQTQEVLFPFEKILFQFEQLKPRLKFNGNR